MRQKTQAASRAANFNRLSLWKYGLLILMFITLMIQAIPTFYGDTPALGVHAEKGSALSASNVAGLLDSHNIKAKSVTQKDGSLVIAFNNMESQQKAKALLADTLGDKAELTIQYASAAPSWFEKLGASPVKLGLDLRGGVQLLLYVDTHAVFDRHADALVSELQKEVRKERLRGTVVRKVSATQISFKSNNPNAESFLTRFMQPYQQRWLETDDDGKLMLTMTEEEQNTLTQSALEQNITILRNRIGELGIVEASVQRQGRDHIRIELPGVHDPKQAKSVIGATASLAFYQAKETGPRVINDRLGRPVRLAHNAVLSGEHIVDARSGTDEMGRPQVDIRLDGPGGDQMADFSRSHIGQPMATVYTEYKPDTKGKLIAEDKVINVATIQSALGNSFRITGLDSVEEAQELSMLLRSGALTAPIQIVSERAIGPTLGAQNIKAGFTALGIGMIGMAIFMTIWYRRFGWVAIVALCANLVMQIGLLVMLPGAVLTLPGIAGLVLTVGMAVDTNVLIFERIRDRLREGASLAASIDFGYRSAFSTIFDANITTLISAACLYAIGSGPLQGFATTLILGLMSSMISGIWGTRAIINDLGP